MAVNPLELRNLLLQKLIAAGFDTSHITQDYWYAIAKALVTSFGEGSIDDHLVKADSTDTSYGPLQTKTKGTNGITLSVITEGGIKKLQIAGPTIIPDDHLVKASDSDVTAVGSLQAKTKGTNGITLSLVTEGGVQKLQITGPTIPEGVSLSSAIPEPDGVGSAGNLASNRAAAEGHVHPIFTKSILYTGVVEGLNRGQVVCCYVGSTTCFPVLFYGWTEGPANTWTKDTDEPLAASHFDGVEPYVGMVALAWQNGLNESDRARSGPYIVDALGGSGTYAVMRRLPEFDESSEFIHGMAFYVLNGTVFGEQWLELTTKGEISLNTTPLTWVATTQSPETSIKGLLTESQLTSVSPDTITMYADIRDIDGYVSLYRETVGYSVFDTLTGTPGWSIIPAGTVSAQIQARLVGSLGDGVTELEIAVQKKVGLVFVDICSVDVTVDSFAWTLKEISQVIAEQAITPADPLRLDIRAHTTSTTEVEVEIVINDLEHSCRITLPASTIELPSSGDHETLIRKNSRVLGVGQHEDTTIDLANASSFNGNLATMTTLDEAIEVVDNLVPLTTVNQPHGWPIDTIGARLVSLSYDPSTRQVTVTASGDTFDVWVHGVKFTHESPYVSVAHDATEGQWYLYHDGTDFEWTQVLWNMYSVVPVATVYWSSIGSTGQGFYELHNWFRDLGWHVEQHSTSGTLLVGGGTLDDYLLDTDTDAALQFSIAATTIADEDIVLTRDAKADGAGFTIWNREGVNGYWTWSTANDFPFLYGTYPQRNYDPGSGWTMADISGVSSGNYVTAYVIATNSLDEDHRYVIIPGQIEYTTLSAAKSETPSALELGSMPFQEFVAIAQLVFHASVSFGGTAKAELASVTRLSGPRGSFSSTALSGTHNSLSGLQGGASGNFYHVPAWEDDVTKFLRSDGVYATAGGSGSTIPSIVPLDANDRAVFYFDDPLLSTSFANSGDVAGSLVPTLVSTIWASGAGGLRTKKSLFLHNSTAIISDPNRWEYSSLTVSGWYKLNTAMLGYTYFFVKQYTSSWADPYFTVRILGYPSGSRLAVQALVGVSPNVYITAEPSTGIVDHRIVPLYEWFHLALTWDGSYLILYLDGNEVARSPLQSGVSLQYGGGEWVIGNREGVLNQATDMNIQDFRICDVARSAAYIADMARRGWTKSTVAVSP